MRIDSNGYSPLLPYRTSTSSSDETSKTANVFLTEIVNLRAHSAFFIGAANFLDKLDQAAIREGRFDFKVEISPPDEIARGELLISTVSKYFELHSNDTAFLRRFALRWQGFSVKRILSIGLGLKELFAEKPFKKIDTGALNQAMRRLQGRKGYQQASNRDGRCWRPN